jgi:prolyl 4-hydroxylase
MTDPYANPSNLRNCAGSSATCHDDQPLEMELEVVSMTPKVFIIPLFLSDFECDEIINLARPIIKDSLVGDRETAGIGLRSTRTSKNSWVKRETNAVTETLSMRAADLMKIDEKLLRSDLNSEELQVVHYDKTQKYDAHNDWTGANRPESRFLTLLIYLNDPDEGGETSFPKGADGLGFKVTPRKGSAVLFYNLLEDGNGDDLALHSAMPVLSGEKWAANYWVWDPKR